MNDIVKDIQDYRKAIADTEKTLAQDEGSLKVQMESLVKEIGNAEEKFVENWLKETQNELEQINKQIDEKITHLKQVFPL